MVRQLYTGSQPPNNDQSYRINNQFDGEILRSDMLAMGNMNMGRGPPPTTTDQYQHRETIWRVLVDIVSLIICR